MEDRKQVLFFKKKEKKERAQTFVIKSKAKATAPNIKSKRRRNKIGPEQRKRDEICGGSPGSWSMMSDINQGRRRRR